MPDSTQEVVFGFRELEDLVLKWAAKRNLLQHTKEAAKSQLLKTMSELGELSDTLLKDDRPGMIDGLGDVLVTLIVFSQIVELDMLDCLGRAYEEIKNRGGHTVGGVFIKAPF